jgi:hypothetical protein
MNQSTCLERDDPLSAIMDGMLRHPAFDAAALEYIGHILTWRRKMGLFNRVATNAGMHIVAYIFFLHYANTSGIPENGATYSRLLSLCEARGNCGSRALRTVLMLTQFMGYLVSSRATSDRRIQIFTPTYKLLAQAQQHHVHAFSCLDRLAPDTGIENMAQADPNFFPNLFATSGKACIDLNIQITEYFPDLDELIQLQGGFPVVASVVQAHMRGHESPSSQSIAKEFHVSSSQVRAVLKSAADRGLVTLSERGQVLDAAPLVAQHKAMIAREMALYAKYSLGLEDYFLSYRAATPQIAAAG